MLTSLVSSGQADSREVSTRSPWHSAVEPETSSSPVAIEPFLQSNSVSTAPRTSRKTFLEMTPRRSIRGSLRETHCYQRVRHDDSCITQLDCQRDSVMAEVPESCHCNSHTLAMSVILLNTAVIAFEAAWISRTELSWVFRTLELLFTCCYIIEVLYRIVLKGMTHFVTGPDWQWNLFDVGITGMGVVDALTVFVANRTTGTGADVARLFRMLRVLRLFRVGRKIRDVDYVIMTSLMATAKLAIIVVVVLFVFATVATHLLWDCEDAEAAEMFQNLGMSMWTLFEVMTGVSWVMMMQPAMDASPNAWWFFTIFVFMVSTALLSLVPAIFIQLKLDHDAREQQHQDSARESARQEKDSLMREGMFTHLNRQLAGTGTVSASKAQKLLADSAASTMHQDFGRSLSFREFSSFVRDVQLGLFVLRAERSGEDVHLDREQFEETMALRARGEDSEKLWRMGVESRREMQLLGYELRQEVERMSSTLQAAMAPQMPEMAQLRKDLEERQRCYDAALQALVARCEQIVAPWTSPESEIPKPSKVPEVVESAPRSEAIVSPSLIAETPATGPATATEVDKDLQQSLQEAFKVAYRNAGESASSESKSGTSLSSPLSRAVETHGEPVPRLNPPPRARGSEASAMQHRVSKT